ncbi:MAG TPA: helix-turn-helix domain-containing protein [Blastocatellia bacterium]|nr:helix-turn-helix domain-containing protein [Blastocatellia bacterium]
MATAPGAQPKWINDPLAAAIGRIVMLEERVKELAEMFQVNIRTLKRWRDEKPARIAYILTEGGEIRYRHADIEAYLKSRERGNSLTQAAKKGSAK